LVQAAKKEAEARKKQATTSEEKEASMARFGPYLATQWPMGQMWPQQ
jgi:hypothetical protein